MLVVSSDADVACLDLGPPRDKYPRETAAKYINMHLMFMRPSKIFTRDMPHGAGEERRPLPQAGDILVRGRYRQRNYSPLYLEHPNGNPAVFFGGAAPFSLFFVAALN
jgi:hypothetical protein